jgi:type II secretory pathway component PulK
VALLIALMTIMMMVGLVADMIVTSSVNIEMATASRDRIRTEYLTKSGFNFAVYMLTMSWGIDLFQSTAPKPLHKDLSDDGKSLWSMVNKLPPMGAVMVELLNSGKKEDKEDDDDEDDDPFKLRGMMNEGIAEKMKLFEDMFSIKISDEASKININKCSEGRCDETIKMLMALFSCPAEKSFLESKKIEPEQMAYRIKDFISNSSITSSESGFSDKNSPYQEFTPSYHVKEAPFDTIDELKLVAGWDDEIHTIFAPYLTVYPYPTAGTKDDTRINVNTVAPELLSCLIPESRSQGCAESYAQKMYKIKKDNAVVFQKDIKETLSGLACLGKDTSSDSSSDQRSKPEDWFDQKSNVFRIEVNASTGRQDRKLIAVVRRVLPQEKNKQREQLPVKRAYQILHWKLL